MSLSIAGRIAPALALAIAAATPAGAQTREVTFTCQGGGRMVVELSPAANGQVIMAIRAGLADAGEQTPPAGTCIPRDATFHERVQRAVAQAGGRGGPVTLRMTTRQPLVLNVEVPADQSPRVLLSSRRTDARAEQTLQLYQTAVEGRAFTVTVREAPRAPLDLAIVGSAAR